MSYLYQLQEAGNYQFMCIGRKEKLISGIPNFGQSTFASSTPGIYPHITMSPLSPSYLIWLPELFPNKPACHYGVFPETTASVVSLLEGWS